MPLYGFKCDACGKEFETLVRSSDTVTCPSCESTKLTRLLSLIAQPSRGGEAQMTMPCGAEGGGGCGGGGCRFMGGDCG